MNLKQKFLLCAIILLAVFFRFYQIHQMPGGLFPDEAANGLDINLMQQGHIQPFYERGNGREALFFYMQWASTAMFGKGQWQMHVVASLVGVLSVIAVFFAAKRIFSLDILDENDSAGKRRSINIALLASFLMAVSTWHVVLSRTAFRANLTPLFGALTIYLLICAYQAKTQKTKLWLALLTGATFALGFYTYIAYRIMAPILFMILFWPLLAAYKKGELKLILKKYWKQSVLFLAAFLIVIFPLANYFYHNFDYFIGRSGQVSIFNQTLYTVNGVELAGRPPVSVVLSVFAEVLKTTLTGFFIHGDLNWRQNISGFPQLSPLISPFFGIGLIIVSFLGIWYFFAPAKRPKYWKYYLLTGWFWGMLLPELATAEGIPHGLRMAGAIVPVFVIIAWVLYEFALIVMRLHRRLWEHVLYHYKDPEWAKNNYFVPRRMRLVNFSLKFLAVCFFAALILQTYFLYFVYAANSPEYFYAFRADLTPVSQYIVDRCDNSLAAGNGSTKNSTFLILDKYSVQTTDYLTSDPKGNFSQPCNVPYLQVDPENSWQLPPLTAGQEAVFTQSSIFDTKKFKQYHPEAYLSLELRNKFDQTVMAVYKTK